MFLYPYKSVECGVRPKGQVELSFCFGKLFCNSVDNYKERSQCFLGDGPLWVLMLLVVWMPEGESIHLFWKEKFLLSLKELRLKSQRQERTEPLSLSPALRKDSGSPSTFI